MKLVKFIEYYSQFKPSQMTKEKEDILIQRFSDSFDDDLDYAFTKLDDEDVP